MKQYIKNFSLIFLAIILWSSCKESSTNITFQIQHIKNIKCSSVKANAKQIFNKIDTSEANCFVYLNPSSTSIGVHKIDKDTNISVQIQGRSFVSKEKRASEFYFYNSDSMFRFDTELLEVYLFNSAGEVLRRISTGSKFIPNPLPKKIFLFSKNLYYSWLPKVNLTTSKQRKLIFNSIYPVCELKISPNNEPLQYSTFGNFPASYLKGKGYYTFGPSICYGQDNQLILSYEADHNIYIYKNSTLLEEKICKSNFIDKFNEVPDDKFNDKSYSRAYQGRESRYTDFIYDPFRSQYYRVTRLEMQLQNRIIQTAQWTIIIMDASFNVIGEVVLPYSLYMPDFIVPAKEGIYIKKSPSNEKEFKGELILSLVKFIK